MEKGATPVSRLPWSEEETWKKRKTGAFSQHCGPILSDCNSSNLVFNAFYIAETGEVLSEHMNEHKL